MSSILESLHAKFHPKESSIDTKPNDSIEGNAIDPKERVEEIEILHDSVLGSKPGANVQLPHDLNSIKDPNPSVIIERSSWNSTVSGSNPGGNFQPLQDLNLNGDPNTLPSRGIIEERSIDSLVSGSNPGGN